MAATDRQFVPLGEVVKAVGLRGEFKLNPWLDFHAPVLGWPHLVWEDGTPAAIDRWRPAGNCLVLSSPQIATREGAEAVVGRRLGFRRQDYLEPGFPRPANGLPFRFLGRPVATVAGQPVGEVVEVRWTGGQLLLVIAAEGRQVLVPAVAPILTPDDGLTGTLVIDPPEGLLDVQD